MAIYYSKEGLYSEIVNIKKFLGFSSDVRGIDLVSELKNMEILIKDIDFKTKGLRGMAIVGQGEEKDIILLNSNRTPIEQNFDCAHEMMHLLLHRKLDQKTFNCFDGISIHQDPYIEWQANEGAAEFFLPYKELLAIILDNQKYLADYSNIIRFKSILAQSYNVPERVVTFRLENLKYEIYQAEMGIPIDKINILAARKQKERNINIKSYNEIADEDLKRRMSAYFNHGIG